MDIWIIIQGVSFGSLLWFNAYLAYRHRIKRIKELKRYHTPQSKQTDSKQNLT
jgi:hypothetical protein